MVGGAGGDGAGGSAGELGTPCDPTHPLWQTCDNWATQDYGLYVVRNNIWGSDDPAAGSQCIWSSSEHCWGIEAAHQNGTGQVKGYPQIIRGWAIGNGYMNSAHGMGIRVSDLTKARIHWNMTAPTDGRYMALWDIYFHPTATPGGEKAKINLMLFQRIVDSDGWFTSDTAGLPIVTLAGEQWKQRITEGDSMSATTRVITLYRQPESASAFFGSEDMTLDLKAMIDQLVGLGYLSATEDYLTGIQIGWEIIWGGTFQTNEFWTALQDEPDPG
jgi:hypothetical protein